MPKQFEIEQLDQKKFIKANELFPDVLILNPNTHVRPVLYLVIPCYNEEKF